MENGAMRTPVEKRTYKVEDIRAILDISENTAYALVRKGVFQSVRVGNKIRISKRSFDQWLDGETNLRGLLAAVANNRGGEE